MIRRPVIAILFLSAVVPAMTAARAQAALRLAAVFGDHMVIQRERPVAVWGWADRGRQVTVEFAGQTASTVADDGGGWQVTLRPLVASSTGRDLRIHGDEQQVVVRNVVVGDVWHASGQSNMAMTLAAVASRLAEGKQDIANANFPGVRFLSIHENGSVEPRDDLPRVQWTVCSPDAAAGFSATAFYFARKLHAELAVPIGIIDSSRGGTPIEPFIPREAFDSHPTLQRELELGDQNDLEGIWKLPGGVRARDANWLPGRLFHSRLAPIDRFAVRGAIWYQGESNCGDAEDPRDYQHKMRALIRGWRTALGDAKLPFYFVQLPGSGARAGWPYLREQQRLSLGLPHTGMVVTIDLRDGNIHPPNKFDVGERLARWALADCYGKQLAFSGPLFDRQEIRGDKIVLHFTQGERGLMVATKDGLTTPRETPAAKLQHFEITDESGVWHPAMATIEGQTVVVANAQVAAPIAARYAYEVSPKYCNFYNRDGLPASPFCSQPQLLDFNPNLPE